MRGLDKIGAEGDCGRFVIVEDRAMNAREQMMDKKESIIELRANCAALAQRNEELDAFACTVAHELKSQLTLVVGLADWLKMNGATISVRELGECACTILRAGNKMSRIIDGLLLLARQRRTEMVSLDMTTIVAEALQRLAHMIEEYEAQIVLPAAWPVAVGYGPWVEEVWVNYLSNALKYGGRPPLVELGGMVQEDGMLRFWVRDNGPGIPPAELARLFTISAQTASKGCGLGLPIVRRIVEKLGGQVGVESQVGRGSVFTFTLLASNPRYRLS